MKIFVLLRFRKNPTTILMQLEYVSESQPTANY